MELFSQHEPSTSDIAAQSPTLPDIPKQGLVQIPACPQRSVAGSSDFQRQAEGRDTSDSRPRHGQPLPLALLKSHSLLTDQATLRSFLPYKAMACCPDAAFRAHPPSLRVFPQRNKSRPLSSFPSVFSGSAPNRVRRFE
ncbi:hypothetical protein MHYP_G00152910 [Metynnis hypsauchen]